jgi:hypothetical protein
MMQKIKGRVSIPNAYVGNQPNQPRILVGLGLTKATGIVSIEGGALQLRRERILLAGLSFTMTSANDYGGAKIADFPNTNMLIAGFALNAKGTILTPNVGTDLTLSLGTAVAAATPLATTAIDYLLAKTGVGAAQAFTCIGHSFDNTTPALNFLDGGASNSIYLNGAAAVASGTCTVAFTDGWVDMFYWDLGEPVALT